MSRSFFSDIDNLSLSDMESEAELIPLMSPEDENKLRDEPLPKSVSLLPLKNTVLFPGVVIPITVGRDKSIRLIKDAAKKKNIIGVITQKDRKTENPGLNDIYSIGCLAQIIRVLKNARRQYNDYYSREKAL